MATIVIEDGTQVTSANSYITEAELTTYATDRGITIAGNTDELIIQAMDYIEQQNFKGYKLTKDQPLQFPRADLYIDEFPLDSDEIPQILKDAQAEVALSVDAGNNPLANIGRAIKRQQLDVIEVEYMDNAASAVIVAKINNKLAKLLASGASGSSISVSRG